MTSPRNPWETLASRTIYENPWIRVREDAVLRPDGKPGIYGVVETKIATGVVALTPSQEVYLVGQWRYPLKQYSWEIIEGGANPDEAPEEAIKRELREEGGLQAARWSALGPLIHLSNCYSDEVAMLYLAEELTEVGASPDGNEELTLRRLPFVEALHMSRSGEITDAMSVIALERVSQLLAKRAATSRSM